MSISKENHQENLESIYEKHKILKEDYLNNVSFLTGHDKLKYMNCLEELFSLLEEQKEILNPKKKFAFSTKPKASGKNENLRTNISKESKFDGASFNIKEDSSDYIIKDKSDATILISEEELGDKNNLIIENLSNCEIKLLHFFKACYIKNVTNSKIYIGTVAGGSHITNVKDSCIYLATHQLRIHETISSHFFIISTSNPIIENSNQLLFSPLKIEYERLADNLSKAKIENCKNKWNSVQDFNWHKKEKSPNYEYVDSSFIDKFSN
jgi:hypothetical protein